MKIWCVYSETEEYPENFHTGCYSSEEKALKAIEEAKKQDETLETYTHEWELDAPLEVY